MQKGNQSGKGGQGGSQQGKGAGRGFGKGPGGSCICPQCGEKLPHKRQQPCPDLKCPKCGAQMVREDSAG